MMPFFSVCVVVRDRPALLVRAVQSVLANDFDDYEIVIVDDGSREPAMRALESAGLADDKHVRVLRQGPRGIASARNAAIAAAEGEFIVVLDSDDELMPDGLERLAERVTQPGYDWVYVDYEEVLPNSHSRIRLPSYPSPERLRNAILTRPRLPFKHSGMTVRRSLLVAIGGYDERLSIKVDVELMLRAIERGIQPRHLPYPIVRFHWHDANVSRQRLLGIKTWIALIDQYAQPRWPGRLAAVKLIRIGWELGKWLVRPGG